jgi:TonB family protein
MHRTKTLDFTTKWHWFVADVMLSLLFLGMLVFMMLGSKPSRKPFWTGLENGAALFVGAADTVLDASSVVSKVPPVYPQIAKQMNITGIVEVTVTVDDSGKVMEATAVNGPAMLRASAESAIKQWKFKSGGKGKVTINFGR